MRVPERMYAMAAKHGISGETIDLIDYTNAQKEVRAARHNLWDTQKQDAEIRI